MLTFQKPIEQISAVDLQRLIDTQTPESRILEFKRDLPGKTSEDKKEFLRDVAAFANSDGGHIVYGLDSADGIAAKLAGIPNETVDGELLRLEQIIRSGIEPVIHGFKLRPVPLQKATSALVIEIPAALFGIHMLRSRGAFVRRTSAGKMEMDFGEIRAAFVGGETALSRLDEFRQQRVAHLKAGNGIVPIRHSAMLAIHLLPLASFAPGYRPDLKRITHDKAGQKLLIPRKSAFAWRSHFTHQGFLQVCSAGNPYLKAAAMYANLFRNGGIEVVESDCFNSSSSNSVMGVAVELVLLQTTQNLLRLFGALETRGPYYVFACLLNLKGWKLVNVGYKGESDEERPFEVDDVILPDAVIDEERSQRLEDVFRPVIDVLWNACGWSESPNYDREGNYVPNWRDNLL